MKKIILAFSLALVMLTQSKAQSVSYTTTLDDPYDVKSLNVHLVPFYMDMSRASLIDMGWELWATADIKKRFRLMTSFRHTYFNLNKPKPVESIPVTEPHTSSNIGKNWKFEAIGQFNFSDYKRNRRIKIILEQTTSGYGKYQTTHTKYIMVPGTVRKSFGLRGGIVNIYTPINVSETKGVNGVAFYGIKKGSTTDTIGFGGGNGAYKSYNDVFTSMNSLVLAAGIDMRTVTNLVVSTDSYGTRSNRLSSNVYIDALLAIYNNYRDVYIGAGDTAYNVKPYGKYPLGWRFGWQYTNPCRTWLSMKMEFGKRPEWKSNMASGWFFDFNMGINIPFKVKQLED